MQHPVHFWVPPPGQGSVPLLGRPFASGKQSQPELARTNWNQPVAPQVIHKKIKIKIKAWSPTTALYKHHSSTAKSTNKQATTTSEDASCPLQPPAPSLPPPLSARRDGPGSKAGSGGGVESGAAGAGEHHVLPAPGGISSPSRTPSSCLSPALRAWPSVFP